MKRWIIKALSLILSSLGCIYQVYHISDQFFDHVTTTKVSIARQTTSYVPVLVFCTAVENVINPVEDNFSKFLKETAFNYWFERTPPKTDLIDSGYYFESSNRYHATFKESGFQTKFQVGKLIKRREVCYSLSYRNRFEFNYRVATSTSGDPVLVSFTFKSTFLKRETALNFFIHSYDSTFHGISNSLAAVHFSSENGSLALYKVILTYAEYQSVLLPAPYDSNCYDYRPYFKSERHCYDECHLKLSVELQNFVPFSVIKDRPINAKMYPALKDFSPKERITFGQIKKNCTEKCMKVQCNGDEFVPILIHSIPNPRLEVALQASPDPLFKTISQPKINLIDFVTYILSCFGFWYGVSCFQLGEKCLNKCCRKKHSPRTKPLFVTKF